MQNRKMRAFYILAIVIPELWIKKRALGLCVGTFFHYSLWGWIPLHFAEFVHIQRYGHIPQAHKIIFDVFNWSKIFLLLV